MAAHGTPAPTVSGPNADETIYARQRLLQLRQQMPGAPFIWVAQPGNLTDQLGTTQIPAPDDARLI